MTVTAIYLSILALMFVVLSIRVIALRGNPIFKFFSFGKNNPAMLDRSIRGHGNFSEYVPIFILLLFCAEQIGLQEHILHTYGIFFFFGRIMHGICFCFLERNIFLRVGGTALTLITISILAIHILLRI